MRRRFGSAGGIAAVCTAVALVMTVLVDTPRSPAQDPAAAASQGAGPATGVALAAALAPPPPGEPTSTATPKKKKKKRNIISWILSLGPGAPIGPPEFTAYRELQGRRCGTVFDRVGELQQPAKALYVGAARACLAAFEGRPRLWRRAESAYAAVAPRAGELTCMDVAALGLLKRLVTLHRKHPNRPFRRAPVTESQAPPCPTIAELQPDRGIEGAVVLISGGFLADRVSDVEVVDSFGSSVSVSFTPTSTGDLQVTMPEAPPPEASSIVCLVVRAEPDWAADGAPFTYEGPAVGAPTPFACPPPSDT